MRNIIEKIDEVLEEGFAEDINYIEWYEKGKEIRILVDKFFYEGKLNIKESGELINLVALLIQEVIEDEADVYSNE